MLFFRELLPDPVKKLLRDIGKNATRMTLFHPLTEDLKEFEDQLMVFLSNSKKMISFAHSKMLSMEEALKKGIKDFSFIAPSKYADRLQLMKYLSTHSSYIYAKISKELDVDMLSASAHKFNGPKGIGFLYIKKGTKIHPFNDGGAQELGMRAGTENVAAVVGMAEALSRNCEKMNEHAEHLLVLEEAILDRLDSSPIVYKRNGAQMHVPGNMSLSFRGASGEMLLHRLDLMGICVSTGSACDSQNTQISHVLAAMNLEKDYAEGTIRISLGKDNTISDANIIGDSIIKILVNG